MNIFAKKIATDLILFGKVSPKPLLFDCIIGFSATQFLVEEIAPAATWENTVNLSVLRSCFWGQRWYWDCRDGKESGLEPPETYVRRGWTEK